MANTLEPEEMFFTHLPEEMLSKFWATKTELASITHRETRLLSLLTVQPKYKDKYKDKDKCKYKDKYKDKDKCKCKDKHKCKDKYVQWQYQWQRHLELASITERETSVDSVTTQQWAPVTYLCRSEQFGSIPYTAHSSTWLLQWTLNNADPYRKLQLICLCIILWIYASSNGNSVFYSLKVFDKIYIKCVFCTLWCVMNIV